MADIVIRLLSEYSDYKHLFLWEEDDGTLAVHDPNTGKQIGVAFPLPEGHGRLVDADALESIIGGFSLNWEYGQGVSDCWDALISAPTILEAEGGGNGQCSEN